LAREFDEQVGMDNPPTIKTARLIIRPWKAGDAAALQRLAGRREIADTMISVPHPFTARYAENWIAGHAEAHARGEALHFAIALANSGTLVGAVELRAISAEHRHAEMSCWIGVDWWGQGLATEAASAMVKHGFERLELNRIVAFHMVRNPASGRALEKIGLKPEGLLRQAVRKWGRFEDVVPMAILREEWAVANERAERPTT
jgi:[ribosomal protein S5]-alanine N-acetyltransferase